jgi:hypothetical protein
MLFFQAPEEKPDENAIKEVLEIDEAEPMVL